jgi:hypothetical protein
VFAMLWDDDGIKMCTLAMILLNQRASKRRRGLMNRELAKE